MARHKERTSFILATAAAASCTMRRARFARYRRTAAFVRCAHARRTARLLVRQRAADRRHACVRRARCNGRLYGADMPTDCHHYSRTVCG